MSPRAACRLETLGFEHVFDYMPGKADWLARGLPREGTNAGEPQTLDYARRDAVSCALDERVGAVRARVQASAHDFALVVSGDGVLLGRLGRSALRGDPDQTAGSVMQPGPSTVRPDTPPERLRERLESSAVTTAVVTDPDGRVLGVVRREDLPDPE